MKWRYIIYFSKQKVGREVEVLATEYFEVAKELVKMLREKYPADRFFIVEIDGRIVNYE